MKGLFSVRPALREGQKHEGSSVPTCSKGVVVLGSGAQAGRVSLVASPVELALWARLPHTEAPLEVTVVAQTHCDSESVSSNVKYA